MLRILPLGLAVALSLLGDLSLYAILVTELDVLHITLAQAGILLSVHRLIRIPANPFLGFIQDFTGRRPIFLTGMVLAVLSTAAYGLVSGFFPLLLSRITWGLAWACIHVSGTTITLDIARSEERGRMAGAYNAWLWVGYALAPLVGTLLSEQFGFQPAMLICAIITAIALLLAFWRVPETLPPAVRLPIAQWNGIFKRLEAIFHFSNTPAPVKKAQLSYTITQFAGDGVILSSMTILLTQRLGEEVTLGTISLGIATISGVVIACRSILAGLISPVFGCFSDQLPRRETAVVIGLLTTAIGFVVMSLSNMIAVTLAGLVLSALGNAACWVSLPALVGDHTPFETRGSQMGRFALAGDLGSMTGPVVALALAPQLGLNPIYIFCCVIFLACVLLWIPVRRS